MGMKNLLRIVLLVAVYLCSVGVSAIYAATEFPIATTSGREMSIGAATDGTNFLVGIQGNASASNNITAQLISASTGALVGSRISIGRTGSAPSVSFDGTNYLMVWADDATSPDVQYGQLISKTDSLVGSAFSFGQSYHDAGGIIFDGINYFVAYEVRSNYNSGDTADVYGQFITTSGTLLGSAIPISTASHGQRDPSLAFDGTKILVVWADGRNQSACYTDGGGTQCNESDIYGQFVTKSGSGAAGTMSGGNFLISASSLPRDNGTSISFDGTRYLVTFPQETTLPNACPVSGCKWDIYGQFVTTAGVADGSTITVSNTSPNHFGGGALWNVNLNRYLAAWTENFGTDSDIVKARYFTASWSPIGNEFVLFSKSDDGLIPLFAAVVPTTAGYLALVNRGITGTNFDDMAKDVYGAFISTFLYANFTGAGIWKWDGSTWSQGTPNNPQSMVILGSNLYGSFAGGGIWKYNGATWTQVTPNTPTMMAVSGSTLYGSFAGGGIWKWNGSSWTQITPNNPQSMVTLGSNLYGTFTGGGIWKYNGAIWTQVTPNNPQLMAATSTILYGSFTGGGIWQWNGSAWSQVTPNNPQLMVTSGSNLYGSFAGGGIWVWNGANWTQATPNNPQLMAASNSNLYGSFAGGGIWQWNGSAWSQVTPNNPASMVLGN
jgi:hypothetical protein